MVYGTGVITIPVLAGTERVLVDNAGGMGTVATTAAIAALASNSFPEVVGITAGTTRTQTGATSLVYGINRVDTSTAPSAGTILGDGVVLPAAASGRVVIVINNTVNPIQVYGNGSDTINGVAAATGIAQPQNSADVYWSAPSGGWYVEGGVGFSGQLNTVLAVDGLTANAGGTQGTAFQMTADMNRVNTAANTTAPYSAVKLPLGSPGLDIFVVNGSANPIQVFGAGTDTIDGQATATGVTQMPGSLCLYACISISAGVAAWITEGLGTGYAGSLQTFSFQDALSANSGGVQSGATPIITSIARFTTVGGAGYSSVLPTAAPGLNITVINAGANNMNVFPAGTNQINGQAASTAYVMPPNSVVEFFTTLTGTWHTLYATNVPIPVVYTTNAGTSGLTLSAANIYAGSNETTLNMTGTLGAGANAQLPLVTALVSQIPNAISGQSYKLRIINSSGAAFAWTVTTNTGWTLNGTMSISQNTWRDFYVTLTSLTAATIQSIGTGTQS